MRQNLLERYENTLRQLAQDSIAGSHWGEAAKWADRWLEYDPMSDEAMRVWMEGQYLAGDREGALARFREYSECLAREVHEEPAPSLRELARRIEADVSGALPSQAPEAAATAGPVFESTLVGRESQWRELVRLWSVVAGGSARLVIIEGEAGIGKTRLAEELLHWCQAEGATVLRGKAYEQESTISYGPAVEALRGILDASGVVGAAPDWLAELARLLPDVRRHFPTLPAPPASGGPPERWRLFEAVAQVVLAVAAERPVVIFIDDLQWCDAETCVLLHFLARRFDAAPVLLIGTVTQGELEWDSPPGRFCRALRIQRHATVVQLPPLTEFDVWGMIREMGRLSTPIGGRRLAAHVHRVTGGNPFYVIELLKTLFAQDFLRVDPETGEWVASSPESARDLSDVQMPSTVRDAILQRTARLPPELNQLLATMAVAGRGARTELLSYIHGMSRLRVASLCDELLERRFLTQEGGFYRCAHSVVAAVVRESITPVRRRELHRAIALSLSQVATSEEAGGVAGEIARHAERGGEPALAYRYGIVASDEAVDRYAFEEALSWLDLTASVAKDSEEADEVNRLTAKVLDLAGWTEPPGPVRRPGTPEHGIERADLDLRVTQAADKD